MERIVSDLETRLSAALEEIGREKNTVLRYDRSIRQVQSAIDELKTYFKAHPFSGKTEEIRYFKELAPKIYWRLFYFMKLKQVESYRPLAGPERFREVLEEAIRGITRFYTQNADICRYYYKQTSYWDEYLFTRRGQGEWSAEEPGAFIDGDFCIGSYWVSWIKANEALRGWLEEELTALDIGGATRARNLPHLEFQGSKTDIYELARAQYEAKSFGDASLKDIISFYEISYNRDLGNHHVIHQEICRRKKSTTKYLDLLTGKLKSKIDLAI